MEILGFAPNLEKEFQGMSSETLTSHLGIAVSNAVGKTRYWVTHWNEAELHKLFVEKK